jgi:hypothetical protein
LIATLLGLETIPAFICRPLNDYPPEVERAELTYCGEFNDSHTAFQLGVYDTYGTVLARDINGVVLCQPAIYRHVEVLMPILVRKSSIYGTEP